MSIALYILIPAAMALFAGGFFVGARITSTVILGDITDSIKESGGETQPFLAALEQRLQKHLSSGSTPA